MDGTLLDTMWGWRHIGTLCLECFGKKPLTPDFDQRVYRMSDSQVAAEFQKYGIALRDRAEYIRIYYKAMEPVYAKAEPLPFVLDFLAKMRDMGIKMCIATATDTWEARPALERTGIWAYMEFALCCTDVGAQKDKPDIYLRAAEKLGLDAAEAVVFEDAAYCVKTAKSAGFRVVGVKDHTASPEDIGQVRQQADRFIESYAELL